MTTITKQLADALRASISSIAYAVDALQAPEKCAMREDLQTAREALAAYDAFMLGVAEAHSDVTTHVGPDLIEVYDEGRAFMLGGAEARA